MASEYCYMDGDLVRDGVLDTGQTMRDFSEKASISKRTLERIMNESCGVSRESCESVATKLGKHPLELGFHCEPPEFGLLSDAADIEGIPADIAERDTLIEALALDMQDRSLDAAFMVVKAMETLPASDLRSRTVHVLKLGSLISNHGAHQLAYDILEAAHEKVLGTESEHGDERTWLEYHLGICLRRLGRLDEAEAVFRPLLRLERLCAAALHQRAVCAMTRGRAEPDAACRKRLYRKAERLLRRVARAWPVGCGAARHRPAFPARRRAQLHVWNGEYAEAWACLKSALKIFARFDCTRYVEATERALDELVCMPGFRAALPESAVSEPVIVPEPERASESVERGLRRLVPGTRTPDTRPPARSGSRPRPSDGSAPPIR
jgi:tetratricopeptide (TPR) repeat protein